VSFELDEALLKISTGSPFSSKWAFSHSAIGEMPHAIASGDYERCLLDSRKSVIEITNLQDG